MDSEIIIKKVFDFFKQSNDFNGASLIDVAKDFDCSYPDFIDTIKEMVSSNEISIQSDLNPHIIRFSHYPVEEQLKILEEAKNNEVKITTHGTINLISQSHLICLYPSPNYLRLNRNVTEFNDTPYSSRLALGEAHLTPVFFEIDVLVRYFSDPRYSFKFDDYSGSISYTEKDNQPTVGESDQIFLKTFGIGQDDQGDRVAVVYLRYLKNLTPEHQSFWKSRQVSRNCLMVKDYWDNTLGGSWRYSRSVFSAFIEEQATLNKICNAIFNAYLFRETFEDENRPKEFSFFFVPTLKNYQDFVLLLDKMISDNLNKTFFSNQGIELFTLKEIMPGTVERVHKGTLALFEEWLKINYTANNPQVLDDIFKTFRQVRKERQNPAHKINEDVYDRSYTALQIQLIRESYNAMRYLRVIFQKHPKAGNIEIPKWLNDGDVKIF